MKNNSPRFQLTLKLHLLPLGVGYEMDFSEGYYMRAPRGLSFPLGPFSPALPELPFRHKN
jgi:hypothetical protein